MKKSTTLKFTNACISKNADGDFIIVETTKDSEKVYNLTEKLNEFLEIEGVALQMGKIEDFPSEE
ncbi:hypothetical protein [Clostridium sp.]|uniref:hypothetical protein n=1 Tax=Clostridium sp. TaxID=1506 RepID=UPI001D7FE8F1|nr:hypothetical protein [Clostridium sp.]MBS5307765.1 hypothetical protein [Clostridium sp.]